MPRTTKLILRLFILSFPLVILSFITPKSAIGGITCCTSDDGRRVCGDTLPQACKNKRYKSYSSTGSNTTYLSPLSSNANQVDPDILEQKNEKFLERKRLDEALLGTYSSKKEIMLDRDRSVQEIKDAIALTNMQIKEHEQSIEHFKKSNSPDAPDRIKMLEKQIKAQTDSNTRREKLLSETMRSFDSDIQRFDQLTGAN